MTGAPARFLAGLLASGLAFAQGDSPELRVAILLGPFTDEQLLVLVEKERALKDMPWHSATAIGVTAEGTITVYRTSNERTPDLAREFAAERCRKTSHVPCSVVMANGDFREAAFLEWARHAQGRSIARLRNGFLGMRTSR